MYEKVVCVFKLVVSIVLYFFVDVVLVEWVGFLLKCDFFIEMVGEFFEL